MKEITAQEIIKANVPPVFEHYIIGSRLSKNEYLIRNKECTEEYVLTTKRGVRVVSGRRNVAKHIAERTNYTTSQAEELIEMKGTWEINKMNIGYKYSYLLFDMWLIAKDSI